MGRKMISRGSRKQRSHHSPTATRSNTTAPVLPCSTGVSPETWGYRAGTPPGQGFIIHPSSIPPRAPPLPGVPAFPSTSPEPFPVLPLYLQPRQIPSKLLAVPNFQSKTKPPREPRAPQLLWTTLLLIVRGLCPCGGPELTKAGQQLPELGEPREFDKCKQKQGVGKAGVQNPDLKLYLCTITEHKKITWHL